MPAILAQFKETYDKTLIVLKAMQNWENIISLIMNYMPVCYYMSYALM